MSAAVSAMDPIKNVKKALTVVVILYEQNFLKCDESTLQGYTLVKGLRTASLFFSAVTTLIAELKKRGMFAHEYLPSEMYGPLKVYDSLMSVQKYKTDPCPGLDERRASIWPPEFDHLRCLYLFLADFSLLADNMQNNIYAVVPALKFVQEGDKRAAGGLLDEFIICRVAEDVWYTPIFLREVKKKWDPVRVAIRDLREGTHLRLGELELDSERSITSKGMAADATLWQDFYAKSAAASASTAGHER